MGNRPWFKMLKAYHTTTRDVYEKIKVDGYIRPRRRLREFGEHGYGFKPDWIAGDAEYVFFSVADFYRNFGPDREDETYGFVFDAEFLMLKLGGLVGPDLLTQYDDLLHACALEISEKLPPKEIDTEGLNRFIETHEIVDEAMIEALKRDETSHYSDILEGMQDKDESLPGVPQALKLFQEKVGRIRTRDRMGGAAGFSWLRASFTTIPPIVSITDTKLEILVPSAVSINTSTGVIEQGKEINL